MNPKITVIVPVYNIEDYLERCINSILAQSFNDFELILVDDGSTDKSGEICDSYAKKDERVRVFHKENGGSSSARNLAIKEAHGEYLSFIDSDDYVEPDFLEKLYLPVKEALDERKEAPKIVQVGRNEIDEDGKLMPDICIPPKEKVFISSRDFFKDLIMHIGDCSFCTKITHKSLFDGMEFPVGKLNEDFHLLIEMLRHCDGVVSLPGYKYHVFYRIGSNSRKKDKNDFSRVFKDNVDNADLVEEIVAKDFPELKKVALRFGLFQRMDYMLHIPIACMNREYEGYEEIVSYIRKNLLKGIFNKYLTVKDKLYLTLFAIAPKKVRQVHARIKNI